MKPREKNTRTRFEENVFPQKCVNRTFNFVDRIIPGKYFRVFLFVCFCLLLLSLSFTASFSRYFQASMKCISPHYGSHSSARPLLRAHTQNYPHPPFLYCSAPGGRTALQRPEEAGREDGKHTHYSEVWGELMISTNSSLYLQSLPFSYTFFPLSARIFLLINIFEQSLSCYIPYDEVHSLRQEFKTLKCLPWSPSSNLPYTSATLSCPNSLCKPFPMAWSAFPNLFCAFL